MVAVDAGGGERLGGGFGKLSWLGVDVVGLVAEPRQLEQDDLALLSEQVESRGESRAARSVQDSKRVPAIACLKVPHGETLDLDRPFGKGRSRRRRIEVRHG